MNPVRLGDILIAGGRVKVADVERALMRQRTTGARIGATLVEAGVVDVDEIARALARQHGVPAALARHLAGRDSSLVPRLPVELARATWALPIALSRSADGLALVVCFRDPTAEVIGRVAAAVGQPVIPAVACELALRREIDLSYPKPPVTKTADDEAVDVFFDEPSQPFAELEGLALVDLDDQGVSRDESQSFALPHLRASGPSAPTQPAVGRIPLPPAATAPVIAPPAATPPPAAPPPAAPLRLDEAVTRIATATSRDAIAEAALDFLRGGWKAALVLVVKDGMALGHKGFGGNITPASTESIVVPLNQPSFLRTAHDDRRAFVGEAPIGNLAQDRFMKLFAGLGTRTVVASPVNVRDRPVCLVFALGPTGNLKEAAAQVTVLAHGMGEAYLRLILEAKKQG